jgi:hypothetical protein
MEKGVSEIFGSYHACHATILDAANRGGVAWVWKASFLKGNPMTITVEIPDELAGVLSTGGKDPTRAVLEAVALEGYRKDLLSEAAVRRLLGFETRMEVHGFLKEHGVFLHYTLEDLEHDSATALDSARRYKAQQQNEPATELHAG